MRLDISYIDGKENNMKEIILYGAGRRGKKVARLLEEKGIKVSGFCDSYISGTVEIGEGGVIPVYSLEYLIKNRQQFLVVITIADRKQNIQVKRLLESGKIETNTVENLLYKNDDFVFARRKFVADFHTYGMDEYYKNAESENAVHGFWGTDSIFYQMFSKLNPDRIVELACGHGRHVPQYLEKAEQIVLVDIVDKNIDFCKKRFQSEKKIGYYVNNGHDLEKLETEKYTAVFTYDAMVHFEMMDVYSYLKETRRILEPGGRALFHHSNNTEDYRIDFSTGKSGRNYMSRDLFAYLAYRAGLEVVEQRTIDWAGVKDLDCITLLEKK